MADPNTQQLAVLVVDDQPKLAALVVQLLSRLGFPETHVAHDPQDALAMMEVTRYALVISDLDMHPMDGLQLLRTVRSDPGLARVPFILAEEGFHHEDIRQAVRFGVDGVLVKPYELDLFRNKIRYATGDRSRRARIDPDEFADAKAYLPALLQASYAG